MTAVKPPRARPVSASISSTSLSMNPTDQGCEALGTIPMVSQQRSRLSVDQMVDAVLTGYGSSAVLAPVLEKLGGRMADDRRFALSFLLMEHYRRLDASVDRSRSIDLVSQSRPPTSFVTL